MVTLDEIEKALSANNTADEISAVNTFREIVWVLGIRPDLVYYLNTALQVLEPLIPIAESFDDIHKEVWSNWSRTVQSVRDILQNKLLAQPRSQKEKHFPNIGSASLDKTSYLSSWITEINEQAPSGLLPAKAIWLIGHRERYIEEEIRFAERFSLFSWDAEQGLADTIRKCSTLKWKHLELARRYLPNWPSSTPDEWKETFLERAKSAPYYRHSTYPDKHDFIHTMETILRHACSSRGLTAAPDSNRHSADRSSSPEPPASKKESSVVIRTSHGHLSTSSGGNLPSRPAFNYFGCPIPNADANVEGLAPDVVSVEPQPDTPADEPLPLASVQSLKVRYSNYRSFIDNQRLPWAWDCLNHFEIASLNQAISQSSSRNMASRAEKQGAFIVWLLMATGQSIDQILKLGLAHSSSPYGCLILGPTYRRYLLSPPKAIRPTKKQKPFLSSHADYVDLPLAPPFPLIVEELGLTDIKIKPIIEHQTIGAYLKLNNAEAESILRQFLEIHRTREFRLLPGKIRNILGVEVMRVSNDPVATHLLTALPSDMPPSGVYYTAYTPETLRHIYQAAISRIFGGNA